MNPVWRERIVAVAAALLAVWLSYNLADGSWFWPLLAGAITLGAILVRVSHVPLDVLAVGVLLMGYMIGNRGFAQLMIIPGVPLLPAEIGLATAVGFLILRCAFNKELPWSRDLLNYALLAWILVGTTRIVFDFPAYGFLAVRDYAAVYYVSFFFITQALGRDESRRRFLFRCLLIASVIMPVVFVLSEAFPAFFLGTLTLRGVPLIFFKGDLAPTFFGAASVMLYFTAEGRHRWWMRSLATLMILWVLSSDNRASMLGAVGALGWAAVSRFRRFTLVQTGLAAFALLVFAAFAQFSDNAWAQKRLQTMGERAKTIVDLSGRFSYRADEGSIKTDNNQFRWVWWRSVADETMSRNPVFGLGFGYDLARGFLQTYNPDLADDFTARSPHNIFVTALGRMGLIGFALLVCLYGILVSRTWRVVRDPASDATQVALWVAIWPIAISACLGVVLEGPMGAVVFWSLLGLATAYRSEPEPIESQGEGEATPTEPQSLDRMNKMDRMARTSAAQHSVHSVHSV